jgi:Fic family protein
MSGPRHSQAVDAEYITDPQERARREAANALEQTDQVQKLIMSYVADGREFKLRPSTILTLQRTALNGISQYAGLWRPAEIHIGESRHEPPGAHLVPELIEDMCEYVNQNLGKASPVHLAAYIMWRLNWIHPFTDGNGRTARAVSYLTLSVATGMILPGSKTIPEQIIANRNPYYAALESADAAWAKDQTDVSTLEKLLSDMLAAQLLSVAELASGTKYDSAS